MRRCPVRLRHVAEYAGHGVDVYEVGDGRQVGNIMSAIWEAYEVARGL
ncbi:MAG: hypothetical protein IKG11_02250 [Atopobiaceae bacterium]|nr:hypothetical protein [Atopobiaceae bacterium]